MAKNTKQYEPVCENKGGRMSKSKRKELLDRITSEFEKVGVFNKSEFARRNNINRATLNNLIKELDYEMDSLEVIKLDLKLVFDRIKNRLFYLLDQLDEYAIATGQPNIKAELEVMKEIKSTFTDFYKLLQELGEAPKVADKVELEGNITTKSINVNIQTYSGERLGEVDSMEVQDYERIANNN